MTILNIIQPKQQYLCTYKRQNIPHHRLQVAFPRGWQNWHFTLFILIVMQQMDPANELRENDYSMGDSNSEIKTVLQALNRHFS